MHITLTLSHAGKYVYGEKRPRAANSRDVGDHDRDTILLRASAIVAAARQTDNSQRYTRVDMADGSVVVVCETPEQIAQMITAPSYYRVSDQITIGHIGVDVAGSVDVGHAVTGAVRMIAPEPSLAVQ